MACQITYNDNNTLEVKTRDGKPSILFDHIKNLPEIESDYQALESWLKVYTNSFKEWFGVNWETLSKAEIKEHQKNGYLDNNGEPAIFFRGTYEGVESFNYSDTVGKFGQGIYLTNNLIQAESFANKTNKKVYPVFIRPGKALNFNSVTDFKQAVADFAKIKTVPKEAQIIDYVATQHDNDTTIIGKGPMGREYNVPKKDYVKSIFSEGFTVNSGYLFDATGQPEMMTEENQKIIKSDKFVNELIARLAENLGMEDRYSIITEEDAAFITRDAKNPWSGQPAFFFKGKVHFIEGQLSYETAFHEFSHPLVEAMSEENPALFERIYNDIIEDPQGKAFQVEAIGEYPEVEPNDPQIKKEVVVKALTFAAKSEGNLNVEEQPSGVLAKIIKKIMYAIKQMLRKISKKASVKDLNPNTTVKELSNMLLDKTWSINMDVITKDDIVSYLNELNNLTDRLTSLRSAKSRAEDANSLYNVYIEQSRLIKRQIKEMGETGREEELKAVLQDITGMPLHTIMDTTATAAATTLDKMRALAAGEVFNRDVFEERIKSLAINLDHIDASITAMKEHITLLQDDPNEKEALRQVHYYVKNMEQWNTYLSHFVTMAEKANIKMSSAIIKDIRQIQGNISTGQDQIQEIYKNSVASALSEVMDNSNRLMQAALDKEIAFYNKKLDKLSNKDSSSAIDIKKKILEKEEQKVKRLIDKDKMADYLTGKMGDVGWLSSNFENFLSMQDPSISSFALYIKSHLSKVQTKTHARYNDFMTELKPLLDEFDISPKQLRKFTEEFTFLDKAYKRNDAQEVEEFEVHTFLNEYQNHKYTLKKIDDELRKAKDEFELDESEEALEKAAELQKLYDNHMKYFFRKRYVDEFYQADDILDSSVLGAKAKAIVDSKMKNIMNFQATHNDAAEVYEDYATAEYLWRDYKQLFSTYDLKGEKKKGQELEMAELLQEWRNAKRDFYEYKPKEGSFESTYRQMKVTLNAKLIDEDYTVDTTEYEEEFERRKKIWLDANTSIKPTEQFYLERQEILDDIQRIMLIDKENKISRVLEELQEKDISDEDRARLNTKLDSLRESVSDIEAILDSLQGRRDEDGQPIGTEMSPEHLLSIKETEEALQEAKKDIEGTSGLSPNEWAEMSKFWEKIENKEKFSAEESRRYKALKVKKSKGSLNKTLKEELKIAFEKLKAMQTRQATTYYIDTVNAFYRDIKMAEGEAVPKDITLENIDDFLQPGYVANLMSKSEEFKKWFNDNHILTETFDERTGETQDYWNRTLAWSVVRPTDPAHMESIEILGEGGQVEEVIKGTPGIKFTERVVKPEYRTGYNAATGEVDENAYLSNQKRQLPKNLEEMEFIKDNYQDELDKHNEELEKFFGKKFAWDHYINREYLALKKENGVKFKLLEIFKKLHYESQEGLETYAKLGDEIARFRKSRYEYLSRGEKEGKTTIGQDIMQGITQTFGKKVDDAEEDMNFEEMMAYIETDMFAGDESKVPIRGTYALDENQVSKDLTGSLFKHYLSAEQNKELRRMQPIAKAMKELAANNNISPFNEIAKNKTLTRTAKAHLKGEINNRKRVIDGMVEMIFEGKKLTASSNQYATTNKVINNMLGLASHSFFALDMTSALKNFMGAQWQIALEAHAGRYYSWRSWQLGRGWAFSAMSNISGQIYSTGPKSLKVQIVDLFDAIQGRFEEKFGESVTRSAARDAVGGTWTTSHRKWLETEASLQLFSAIMHDTRVEQIQPDGSVKKIRYIDAWAKNEETGQIELKEGIDKKWDVNGTEFEAVKFKNHEVSNLLQGAYAQMDQPLLSRYMPFRLVSSMKKYFTKMLMHRYGHGGMTWKSWKEGFVVNERYNAAIGDTHLGFYWQNFATIMDWARTGGKSMLYTTPKQWKAMFQGFMEIIKLQLFTMLWQSVFSFDPDDKDKWKKMKKRSGALPSVFTDEEWSEGFNWGGWLANHAVLLAISAESEYKHFIPFSSYGMKDLYNVMLGDASISAGGSAKLMLNTLAGMEQSYLYNNPASYYKSNRGGAFNVHQEGEAKFWIDLYKMIGLKEKLFDPVTATKNLYGVSSEYKIK